MSVCTTCCYCGVGCGIVVSTDRTGRLSLAGDPDHPSNRGILCSKGRTLLHAALDHSNRLLHPELRTVRGQPRRRASWEAAIGHAARELLRIREAYGPDSIAVYGSGQWLTEEYYLINKLVKGGLGTNNLDTNSRLCMSSAVAGYTRTLGADGPPGNYEDLELADTLVVTGANPAWCHPVLWRRVEAAKAARPAMRIVVIDPRTTDTAELADLHLRLKPGSDVALYLGLGRRLIATDAIDRGFITDHTNGFDAWAAACEPWTEDRTAETCGISADDLRQLAVWIASGRNFVSAWTMGLNQASDGVARNTALIALHLATGSIGRPGTGPFSLTGQPNAMGGREVGGMATLLSNHRNLASAADRAEVAKIWGVESLPSKPGLTAVELFQAIRDGRVRAVWICATNPVESMPDAGAVDAALARAELVIAQDAYATATTDLADIVFPAATWLEKTGTMTNSERRIALLEPALPPPGEALPDAHIFRRMAEALGLGRLAPQGDDLEAELFAEHAALSAGRDCDVSGLSHARLRGLSYARLRGRAHAQLPEQAYARLPEQALARHDGLRAPQWPVAPGGSGTLRLYTDHRFAFPDGRAKFPAPVFAPAHEPLNAEFPLVLTTTRLRDQWHTRTRTGRVRKLNDHAPVPTVEIHPSDAAARGISDNDVVDVDSRRGAVRVLASLTDRVRPGVIALPMHWGKRLDGEAGRTNVCTSPRFDPVSKEPDLKFAAAQIRRHAPPRRRIVVIGAGAAALAFIHELRRLGRDDPVLLVGDEPREVYNRVALPHYVAGDQDWSQLVRADREQLAGLGVQFLAGVRATAIDRAKRIVHLSNSGEGHYDTLVLATGSRPARSFLGDLPKRGVHVLRHREDADAIRAAAGPGASVVVVGGGLLGIELADALITLGTQVTLLQRSDRLMGKQLDVVAANLLAGHLRWRGIDLRFNAQVDSIPGDTVREVILTDGTRLPCAAVVFATGTAPNAELARAAVLTCSTGVMVDRDLRTSDQAIFAIGEVAEFSYRATSGRTGSAAASTTAAAALQGRHLAEVLRGNPHHPYAGPFNQNLLKIHGFPLASCGETDPGGLPPVAGAPPAEVVTVHDPALGVYQKVVIRADRVVGALCIGDLAPFPGLARMVETGTELDEARSTLLRGKAAAPPDGRLVCSCNQIGEHTLRREITAGCRNVDQLVERTLAGAGCGSCRPEIARLARVA